MKSIISRTALAIALAGCAMNYGCTANVHDNELNVKDPKISFNTDVDVDNVEQGQSVAVAINAENVTLVAPDAQPPPEHVDDAAYFKIFLDDEDDDPLLITAETKVTVKIPEDTDPGDHKLICRLNKHDGTPTDFVAEIDITVEAKVSTTTGG